VERYFDYPHAPAITAIATQRSTQQGVEIFYTPVKSIPNLYYHAAALRQHFLTLSFAGIVQFKHIHKQK